MMVYYQVMCGDLDTCDECGECANICPQQCFDVINFDLDNFDDCTACGECLDVCSEGAIRIIEIIDGEMEDDEI